MQWSPAAEHADSVLPLHAQVHTQTRVRTFFPEHCKASTISSDAATCRSLDMCFSVACGFFSGFGAALGREGEGESETFKVLLFSRIPN